MNALTKDRIRLIRAMQLAERDLYDECPSVHISEADTVRHVIDTIREDRDGHFLSFSQDDPQKVSYATKPEFRFDSAHRTKTTLARYLRRRLKIDANMLSDKTLSTVNAKVFGILVASGADKDVGFDLVQGEDIVDAYRYGYGQSSCMSGTTKLVAMYGMNPDKVSMLKYDRNGQTARAIVWHIDGTLAVDRIYPNSGYHVDAIWEWAKRKGYDRRANNHAECSRWDSGKNYTVTLRHNHTFPFMDTMLYADIRGSKVTVSNYQDGQESILQCTGGGYLNSNEEEGYTCYACGTQVHEDYVMTSPDGETYCEDCYNENYAYCDQCEHYIPREDLYYIESLEITVCLDCRDRFYIFCDTCQEYYTEENTTWVEDNDKYYCESCLESKTETGDIVFCDTCGEYHGDTETYLIEDTGEMTCEDPHENQIELAL